MKDRALSFVRSSVRISHNEIELLHSHNTLLTQHLDDCMNSMLEEVSQSFENALDHVEYFHHPLTLFME